jgi:DinB family protein
MPGTAQTPMLSDNEHALLAQLAISRAAVIVAAHEGRVTGPVVRDLANEHASLAARLHPMPPAPAAHLRAAHALSRPHLERLAQHDPARLVLADEEHSYTPRKILRRVLDHALDHLNQIEQWRRWQEHSGAPVPTDGWATSAVTFGEDVQPLSAAELAAWLWRIDLTIELVARQAEDLTEAQLDWTPPDSGWTLRRMLRHLALAEMYYAVWLDEPLPDEPLERYAVASERFADRLRAVFGMASDDSTSGRAPAVLFAPSGGAVTTGEEIACGVLATERDILAVL